MEKPLKYFTPYFLKIFQSFATQILPVVQKNDLPANTNEVAKRAEVLILERDGSKRFLLKVFLFFVQFYSFILYRKIFTSLSADKQIEYLSKLENFSMSKIRQGFWGVKNLVFWGYYTQISSWPAIHYGGPLVKREDGGGRMEEISSPPSS